MSENEIADDNYNSDYQRYALFLVECERIALPYAVVVNFLGRFIRIQNQYDSNLYIVVKYPHGRTNQIRVYMRRR